MSSLPKVRARRSASSSANLAGSRVLPRREALCRSNSAARFLGTSATLVGLAQAGHQRLAWLSLRIRLSGTALAGSPMRASAGVIPKGIGDQDRPVTRSGGWTAAPSLT